jgi:gluconate 2-dehydrogenase gamma chain
MTGGNEDNPSGNLSRRALFKGAAVGAAVLAGGQVATTNPALAQQDTASSHLGAAAPPRLEARETLTAAEADVLEAFVARLIPSDESGPGASEARAAYYIDRALAGPLHSSRDAYADNLAAVDAYALSKKGAAFAQLSPADQDAVLTEMENNVATGFSPNAATFFNMVRTHTIQGMFCDPYYGGNANFIGWDLIGYPGIRMAVGEDEQHLKAPRRVRKSAYDDTMFTMNGGTKGGDHGHRP